ncbi:MAG: hypothetical protein ACRCV6_00890 [Formosimonas sp.]
MATQVKLKKTVAKRKPKLPHEVSEEHQFEAQDLIFDAYDSDSWDESKALARKALLIDPWCTDAYVVLADCVSQLTLQIKYLEKGIALFEERYGAAYFEANAGHFWGLLETRPYMRALHSLSVRYGMKLRYDDEIKLQARMLELCPNDNLGVRYDLVPNYMIQGQFDEVTKLFNAYPDDNAFMAFHQLLAEIMQSFPLNKIKATYKIAVKRNPHLAPYLAGIEPYKWVEVAHYSLGSIEEAHIYVQEYMSFWRKTEGAQELLKQLIQSA